MLASCTRGESDNDQRGDSENKEVVDSEATDIPVKARLLTEKVIIGDHKKDIISKFGNPDEIEQKNDGVVKYVMTYKLNEDAFYKLYFDYQDRVVGKYSELQPIGE